MELLFKREQTSFGGRVKFKLWTKIELTEAEQEIIRRYRFSQAVVVDIFQPRLLTWSLIIGAIVGLIAFAIVGIVVGGEAVILIAAGAAIAAGYWYFHSKRETIYVRDLMHGRYFSCPSVIDLARKEAWLETVVSFLRQVMESAKHWDGTESMTIEPLPKAEAKHVMIQGL
ncbi:MAG: hypothetical protein AAF968_06705 [Pseudomonadota bacterium]